MTVHSLETARSVVEEDSGVVAVYEYRHALTGNKLWSVEHRNTVGTTLASEFVASPRLIYTREEGWAADIEKGGGR